MNLSEHFNSIENNTLNLKNSIIHYAYYHLGGKINARICSLFDILFLFSAFLFLFKKESGIFRLKSLKMLFIERKPAETPQKPPRQQRKTAEIQQKPAVHRPVVHLCLMFVLLFLFPIPLSLLFFKNTSPPVLFSILLLFYTLSSKRFLISSFLLGIILSSDISCSSLCFLLSLVLFLDFYNFCINPKNNLSIILLRLCNYLVLFFTPLALAGLYHYYNLYNSSLDLPTSNEYINVLSDTSFSFDFLASLNNTNKLWSGPTCKYVMDRSKIMILNKKHKLVIPNTFEIHKIHEEHFTGEEPRFVRNGDVIKLMNVENGKFLKTFKGDDKFVRVGYDEKTDNPVNDASDNPVNDASDNPVNDASDNTPNDASDNTPNDASDNTVNDASDESEDSNDNESEEKSSNKEDEDFMWTVRCADFLTARDSPVIFEHLKTGLFLTGRKIDKKLDISASVYSEKKSRNFLILENSNHKFFSSQKALELTENFQKLTAMQKFREYLQNLFQECQNTEKSARYLHIPSLFVFAASFSSFLLLRILRNHNVSFYAPSSLVLLSLFSSLFSMFIHFLFLKSAFLFLYSPLLFTHFFLMDLIGYLYGRIVSSQVHIDKFE